MKSLFSDVEYSVFRKRVSSFLKVHKKDLLTVKSSALL